MYTILFFILAAASGIVYWVRDSATALVLFTLFSVLYLISLIFDIGAEKERALEDYEEDDPYEVEHYF